MSNWLGVCGGLVPPSACEREEVGYWTNKIGGAADWMADIPWTEYCCRCCGRRLELVVQLYAPLENSVYHRTLYILCCLGKCKGRLGSWRVLRSQCVDDSALQESASQPAGADPSCSSAEADDWGVDQDDWGATGAESTQCDLDFGSSRMPGVDVSKENIPQPGPVSGVESTVARAAPQQTKYKTYTPGPASLTSFYIDVYEETAAGPSTDGFQHELELLKQYGNEEGLSMEALLDNASTLAAGASAGGEEYESSKARHGDRIYHKFLKALNLAPTQCLRYKVPLKALGYSDKQPLPDTLRCEHCDAVAQPEVQLMPPLLSFLQPSSSSGSSASVASNVLDFGTVVVYCCSESCWQEGCTVKSEKCLVYLDPDVEKLENMVVKTSASSATAK